ncbi:MAG TPA: hypothetical protein VMA71_02635 [Alloacidobacterium sp.]|nr:hypothetical protein [Alloacidobacterium sp.]
MTNRQKIVQALTKFPEGLCDDCLANEANLARRQVANAECRLLEKQGAIQRIERFCKHHRRSKLTNILMNAAAAGSVAPEEPPISTKTIPSPDMQIVLMTKYLRCITDFVEEADPESIPQESLAKRIARLRGSGHIPANIVTMMLTVNGLRHHVVKGLKRLSADEWQIADSAMHLIENWHKSRKLAEDTKHSLGG